MDTWGEGSVTTNGTTVARLYNVKEESQTRPLEFIKLTNRVVEKIHSDRLHTGLGDCNRPISRSTVPDKSPITLDH